MTAPASLTLTASATDSAGIIKQVAFYNGNSLMGTVTQAPYRITIPDTSAGTYTITAQATDSLGNTATSNPVTTTVNPPLIIGPWVTQAMPTGGYWHSVAYGNGRFVVSPSAGTGTVAVSTDNGVTWTPGTISNGNGQKLQYGNGVFVNVVNNSNAAQISPDGLNWTLTTLPVNAQWVGLAYGNGLFVATSANYSAATVASTDGITWHAGSLPSLQNWTSIAYGNGKFVALGSDSNVAATSSDGINWTQQTLPLSAGWTAIAYGNGLFVAVESYNNTAISSPDGVNWTQSTLPTSTSWDGIAYGNGMFVAISNNGYTATTTDGLQWNNNNIPQNAMNWVDIAFGNNIFVAVGQSTNSQCTTMGVETTPPAVAITTPGSTQHFMVPTNINLTATASSNVGIAQVQYFNGNTLIGTATQSPYTVAWNNPAAGIYPLTAVATDNDSITVTSAPYTLTIEAPLSISITNPLSGSQMTAGNVTLSANPVETNGTITQVAFYNGSTLMGTVTQVPYSLEFKNAALGNGSLCVSGT